MHFKKASPLDRSGTRHIDCPFYDQCLEQAVQNWWDCWSCGNCRNYAFGFIEKRMQLIEEYKGALFQIYPELEEKYEQIVSASRHVRERVSSSE